MHINWRLGHIEVTILLDKGCNISCLKYSFKHSIAYTVVDNVLLTSTIATVLSVIGRPVVQFQIQSLIIQPAGILGCRFRKHISTLVLIEFSIFVRKIILNNLHTHIK